MATAQLSEPMLHSEAGDSDFPYRAISRSAIVSVLLFFPAIIGLLTAPLLVFAVCGIIAAVLSLSTISRYPQEFSGRQLALVGLTLNAVLLVIGIAEHSYIYATEVPEGYNRVAFYELQQPEPLPDIPTAKALEINGQDIFLKGYIHPSSGSGVLRRFILVPDLGTCCFGGQPRSTDMIEVTLTNGQTVTAGLTKLKLAGKFSVIPQSEKLADFDNAIYYHMRVDQLR